MLSSCRRVPKATGRVSARPGQSDLSPGITRFSLLFHELTMALEEPDLGPPLPLYRDGVCLGNGRAQLSDLPFAARFTPGHRPIPTARENKEIFA
jgi:hypothetical protein